MYVNYVKKLSFNEGFDTEDGLRIYSTDWETKSWWKSSANWSQANGGSVWDENIWKIRDGWLPKLRHMPEGIQDPEQLLRSGRSSAGFDAFVQQVLGYDIRNLR